MTPSPPAGFLPAPVFVSDLVRETGVPTATVQSWIRKLNRGEANVPLPPPDDEKLADRWVWTGRNAVAVRQWAASQPERVPKVALSDLIAQRISSGAYPSGHVLIGAELAAEFNVTPRSITRALTPLREAGKVVRQGNNNTVV